MAFVIARNPELSIMLGQSAYHDIWMPPQEGVQLSETFESALHRCLEDECGLDIRSDPKILSRLIYVRSYRYMGIINLPLDRHGERLVADDAVGTLLESVKLKRKAYWMATILLSSQSNINPKPDGNELIKLKWFTFAEAEKVIQETNHEEKAVLLMKSLDACRRDVLGGSSPKKRKGREDILH